MQARRVLAVQLALLEFSGVPAVGRGQTASELARERYSVDGMHSTVGFAVTLLRAVKVRGRFNDYDATIIFDEKHPERSSVTAVIQARSINTDMGFRDDHLRSPDFFDVKKYPTIEFVSDQVTPRKGGAQISGVLTMHGVSRRVTFPARMVGEPYVVGSTRGVAFSAELHLSRKDYGIAGTNKFNPDYNPLTNMLSDNVDILLELDAIRDGFADRRLGGRTPPSVADTVYRTLHGRGIDAALRIYSALRSTEPSHFDFGAYELDALGRKLAECGELDASLAILRLNAAQFPDSAGVLESLAESQALSNDRAGAIETYRQVLGKFPNSANAREMLRRLGNLPQQARAATAFGQGKPSPACAAGN